MKLKSTIFLTIAFVAICFATDFVFTHVAIYNNASGDAGRLYHLIQAQDDEIPILGASTAYQDYIPSEMGVNAYNYGLNGSSYEVVDALLGIELAKPRTTPVIVDLQFHASYGLGDESAFIPLTYNPYVRQLLERTKTGNWRYSLPGIRYFGHYGWYLKELINDRYSVMRKVVRGYAYEKYTSFDRTRMDLAVKGRLNGKNEYSPDEDQDRRLLAQIQGHPERLFFLVYAPLHASHYTHFENMERFNAFKAKLSALPNVALLDYGRVDYPDEWYKDTSHLLQAGATDFSRKLGEKIRETLRERHLGGK